MSHEKEDFFIYDSDGTIYFLPRHVWRHECYKLSTRSSAYASASQLVEQGAIVARLPEVGDVQVLVNLRNLHQPKPD